MYRNWTVVEEAEGVTDTSHTACSKLDKEPISLFGPSGIPGQLLAQFDPLFQEEVTDSSDKEEAEADYPAELFEYLQLLSYNQHRKPMRRDIINYYYYNYEDWL